VISVGRWTVINSFSAIQYKPGHDPPSDCDSCVVQSDSWALL
jgi:hypothetical protein